MNPLHSLARSFIAPIFLAGGLDALRHPASKVSSAEKVLPQLNDLGITQSPTQLVRINGCVQVAAGLLLLAGRLPRAASAALAVSLVPTTFAGHRFWEEEDPTAKAIQKTQFLKNVALFGGLILAAVDRNGSPSMAWRAKKSVSHASSSLQSAGSSLASHGSRESMGDMATAVGDVLRDVAAPLLARGLDFAGNVGSSVADRAIHAGESVQAHTNSLIRSL